MIIPSLTVAQDTKSDTLCMPKAEFSKVVDNIKKLQEIKKIQKEEIEVRDQEIELNEQEIKKLESIIYQYKVVSLQDSLIINFKDQQIVLLKENIELWEKKAHTPWYKSHTMGIIKGILLVSTSAWVFSQIQ